MEKTYDAIQINGVTVKDFVLNAIDKLASTNKATGEKYKTIHVVYTGFNEAFSKYFGQDARSFVDEMVKDKVLAMKPIKGGILIWKYDAEWAKANAKKAAERNAKKKGDIALDKILG